MNQQELNEKLEAHARFVEGLAAQHGGATATASIHDFDASPLCCGTVKSINIKGTKPLAGVNPVDSKGNKSKSGEVGAYEFVLVTPEGAEASVIPFSASLRSQLKSAAAGRWEHPATPLDPEALAQVELPPFVGTNLAILFCGRWSEGEKSGDRFKVILFPDREDLVGFHKVYQEQMRARRAKPVTAQLEDHT